MVICSTKLRAAWIIGLRNNASRRSPRGEAASSRSHQSAAHAGTGSAERPRIEDSKVAAAISLAVPLGLFDYC